MMSFTYRDDDKYFKMDIINRIKNNLSLLIRNTKSDLKYYSSIELGEHFDNPHIHIQFFYNDLNQILAIRDKVISEYGLFSEYCEITTPKCLNVRYDYIMKDYKHKNLSDEYLLTLDDVKRDYRLNLQKNLRFSSFSKEKYTKKIYKSAYSKGILKGCVDYLIDNEIINKSIEVVDSSFIYYFKILLLQYLVQYRIKMYLLSDYLEFITKYQKQIKVLRIYGYF